MRIYSNFKEAVSEVGRDIAEMGIEIQPNTMQDKYVGDDKNYLTKEIQNYVYTVINPLQSVGDLTKVTRAWANAELLERVGGIPLNPGKAYLHRIEVWQEFLHDGKFGYTYPERMSKQLDILINEIRTNPTSRQLYLSIWSPEDLPFIGGERRVPCSLGYLLQVREGKLNITYSMRSCDFMTHYQNDVFLAVKLMEWMAAKTGYEPGNFTHVIGSLHVYAKDVEGIF